MDDAQPARSRRRGVAIIAAAGLVCLAIAIPVSGAFGAGESGNGSSGTAAPSQRQGDQGYWQGHGPAQGQGRPPAGPHRRDGNCPKHHRGQGGSSGSGSSDSSAPAPPGDSLAL